MNEEIPSILVVDDDLMTLNALKSTLAAEGYQVHLAQNGKQALEIIKEHPLAVILCDQYMPEMSGVEVLKEAIHLQPDAARIVITGVSDLNIAADLVNVGQISHFILKPWDPNVLVHSIRASIDRVRLIKENKRLHDLTLAQHKELVKNHEHLQRDLVIGGRIQCVLLEGKVPPDLDGINIKGLTIPSQVIDGDFYDFYKPTKRYIDIVVGDVMGKGLPAALVGTAVKTQLTRFAMPITQMQSFLQTSGWEDAVLTPVEILSKVHSEISSSLIDLEYFVCLTYGRFDLQKRMLNYIDCGSTKPLHLSGSSGEIKQLSGKNFPLGIQENETYHAIEVPFEQDDLFVFYSDGVSEAQSPEGELFGISRLSEIIRDNAKETPEKIVQKVKNAVEDFTTKETLTDDLTLIIFKIEKLKAPKEFTPPNQAKFTSNLSQLEAVRTFVKRICAKAPGDMERLTSHMELMVNEAFCNIVKHGYKNHTGGDIYIKADLAEEAVVFQIKDQGDSFDPTMIENPCFTGDKEGGFGMYMMKEIADGLSYCPKHAPDGWNRLQIFKLYCQEDAMDISYQTKDDVLVITIEGKNLDAKEAPGFKQKAMELIDSSTTSRVVLDLNQLNFIDSTGLGSFLSILRILNRKKGDLKMASMSPPIRTVFELVCMHKIFEIHNTIEEAISSYNLKEKVKK